MRAAWTTWSCCNDAPSEFDESEVEKYDVVIINSVVQYFPSVEYLVRVLEGAVQAVAPGRRDLYRRRPQPAAARSVPH